MKIFRKLVNNLNTYGPFLKLKAQAEIVSKTKSIEVAVLRSTKINHSCISRKIAEQTGISKSKV